MAEFDYMAPSSVEATLHLLKDTNHPALLAGGTQLLPDIRAKHRQPTTLIDLRHLDTLKYIRLEDQHIAIGARTTLAEIERSQLIQQALPLLAAMSRSFATPLVRSSATLGGNIASLTPIADAVVPLLALNATLSLQAHDSHAQSQPIASFITTYMQQAPFQELLTQISVPVLPEDTFWFYYKLGQRQAGAVSIVSVALVITLQAQRIQEACIALGAITHTPIRATQAEAALLHESLPLSNQTIERCLSALVVDLQHPCDDLWASATYRVKMGQALIKKALKQLPNYKKEDLYDQ
jgi:xanthine dehydrogenase small subunit